MSGRTWLDLGLALACAAFLALGFVEHNARVAARAQQEVYRQQAAEAARIAQEARGTAEAATTRAQVAEDSLRALADVLQDKSDSLNAVLEQNTQIVAVASSDLGQILFDIRRLLPDQAKALADSAEAKVAIIERVGQDAAAAFRSEREARMAFVAQADSVMAEKDAAIDAGLAAADRWHEAYLAMEARALAAEKLATPGLLGQLKLSLPFLSVQGTVAAGLGAAGCLFFCPR